jgi:hypothetical protein
MFDEMSHEGAFPEGELIAWRKLSRREVERIGVDEFSQRLNVSEKALHAFLDEGQPTLALRTAVSVYEFDEYTDLKQLMLSYFHDSYDQDTGSLENWQSAIDDFVAGSSGGRVSGAASDIRRLLAVVDDDKEIQRKLVSLGCCFAFKLVPMTPKQWLTAVHDRLVSTVTA